MLQPRQEQEMDWRIIILGLGADPRIYGEPRGYTTSVLTYPEQPSDPDAMLFALELLFEGGLDLLLGLLELLF
jgi:hypothetical protein